MPGMTDRDHFAAAALTGLLYQDVDDEFAMPYIVGRAYLLADAMLRERCRGGGDCPGSDNAPNLDAAPAAKAGTPGTGDTQSFDAYRRFVGEVMNWISEATSAADWSSDGGRKIMADACSRCWDAFDRIAYPTVHGASPEARARIDADRGRTDKAAPRPSRGTGDTPATHATRGEGSEQRECTEPVAWAVCCPGDGNWSPCFFHEPHAQRHASAILGSKNIVPLYRSPTLTDAERDDICVWLAECLRQASTATEGCNEELAEQWTGRAKRAAAMLERLGGEG